MRARSYEQGWRRGLNITGGIESFASHTTTLLSRKLAAAKERLDKQQGEGERVAALEEQVRLNLRLQVGLMSRLFEGVAKG